MDTEIALPQSDTERGAICDLLKNRPQILKAAQAHAARVTPAEPAAPRMTAVVVQSAIIDKVCGTKPKAVQSVVTDVMPDQSTSVIPSPAKLAEAQTLIDRIQGTPEIPA